MGRFYVLKNSHLRVIILKKTEALGMPRKAHKKSSTGIYHVMLRGINQQQIFSDDEDYNNMLQIIREYKESTGIDLYAYCLMGNHIHLP